MNEAERPLHLDVHPLVVFELGESLISDEVQALVELVKNAYDADATYARVTVDTAVVTSSADSFFPGCTGRITVEDDGTGMDRADIEAGWLIIANSPKRHAKERRALTPKYKRTPLGDKGLGRLGVQRLGNVVELYTTKVYVMEPQPPESVDSGTVERPEGVIYHVGIDWREFWERSALSDIPVEMEAKDNTAGLRGTRVVVSALHDPTIWAGTTLDELQRKLGQVIFPFGEVRPFRVYANVNGESLDLAEISQQVRNAATSRFHFSFRDGILRVDGTFKFTAFRPPSRPEQDHYHQVLVRDRGLAFYNYLALTPMVMERTGVQYSQNDPWFLTTHNEKQVDRLADLATVRAEREDGASVEEFADPGPFEGEIDTFDLGPGADRAGWTGTYTDFNDLIKQYSGVRIFRDGFAIRPYGMDGNDWLGLGATQTAGTSFYGLRPRNTIGYISISAEKNSQLTEKTDREAFKDTPYSRNFFRLMSEVIDSINHNVALLRRQYNDFQRTRAHDISEAETHSPPEVLYERIRATARGMSDLRRSAEELERVADLAESASSRLHAEPSSNLSDLLRQHAAELRGIATSTRNAAQQIRAQVERSRALGANADALERDLDRVRQELTDFVELGALGISAEAVSHELRTVAADLTARTRNVLGHMRTRKLADPIVLAYAEHVRSSISTLRRQLAHLAPGLRYVREVTDVIDMQTFVIDLVRFHQESYERRRIMLVIDEPADNFTVRMNRGKLTQVVDNLMLNSRYWLGQDLAAGYIDEAEIHFRLADSSLYVWDTGRGIDQSVERTLFEPFVTNKPKGKGRGLGLFIARQLLQSSGCHLELTEDRNRFGSLYRFRVDLTGALQGR